MAKTINSDVIHAYGSLKYDDQYVVQITDQGELDFVDNQEGYNLFLPILCRQYMQQIVLKSTVDYTSLPKSSLLKMVNSTRLSRNHNGIYTLIKLTLLEVSAIRYLATDNTFVKYVTNDTIDYTRENIVYCAEWLHHYRSYRFLTEYFRKLDISIGYLESDLKSVINSTDLSRSIGYYLDNQTNDDYN